MDSDARQQASDNLAAMVLIQAVCSAMGDDRLALRQLSAQISRGRENCPPHLHAAFDAAEGLLDAHRELFAHRFQ